MVYFTRKGRKLLQKQHINTIPLTVKDYELLALDIELHDQTLTKDVVGVWKTPNGSMAKQMEVTTQKILEWIRRITDRTPTFTLYRKYYNMGHGNIFPTHYWITPLPRKG